ncbi:hypothetical protein DEEACLCL_00006 [Salmonella phage CRW-SP2]|nr:hypothetical protein DEEACLCL_00006 [Salmonella phage CRW-SP2]
MAEDVKLETMSIEDIMADIEPLISVDPNDMNLDQISMRTGRSFMIVQRHYIREGKYLEYLYGKQKEIELWLKRYYGSDLPPHAYEKRPLKTKPLKTEIDTWMKADDMYVEMSMLVYEQKAKVKFIESCLERLNKMGYEIRAAIDWRKYLDGN